MRRTVGVVVGACTVLALAGAAGAAYTRGEAEPVAVGAWHAAPASAPAAAPQAAPGARSAPAEVPSQPVRPAPRPTSRPPAPATPAAEGTEGAEVRQRIGTVEVAERTLGYLDGGQETTFRYPGASYVKVHFDRLLLLPGDYVTVADPDGTEVHRYDATPLGELGDLAGRLLDGAAEESTARWAMSVSGDTAVVRLHRNRPDLLGLGSLLDRLGVRVDRVARGYTDAERRSAPAVAEPRPAPAGGTARPGEGREESICGADEKADAVCYRSADPVVYSRTKAVARLLINGVELCTGWRVGADNRMLTNNHCFDSSASAYQTEVWFNYQCAACGGYEVFQPTKVWGDRVLATDRALDFTLFTVENFEQIEKFGHLELETRRPRVGEELYIPQHPGGQPTMVAISGPGRAGNCSVVDPAYHGYAPESDVSYYCDTEGGSSGSPVLSRRTDRVVALHHFGGCPNSGVRADLVYDRISSYL